MIQYIMVEGGDAILLNAADIRRIELYEYERHGKPYTEVLAYTADEEEYMLCKCEGYKSHGTVRLEIAKQLNAQSAAGLAVASIDDL